jgi:beta-1,4-mannosyltransferase
MNYVFPHGEYLSWYGQYPQSSVVPGRLSCFGRIRAYKGVSALTEAFTANPDDALTLVLAGKPETDEFAAALRAAARSDDRIHLDLEMVSHDRLVSVVTESELVVLPYTFYNSGAIILALSLGRPVVAAACPALEELAEETGPNWVFSYEPPLTATTLCRVLSDVRSSLRADRAPLTDRDWTEQAGRLAAVYRTVAARFEP